MTTRRRLRRAADALVPAEFVMLDMSWSLATTHVLGVVAGLGIPDLLAAGPRSAAELAGKLKVDAHTLHRVLRAAAAMDVLKLDGSGRFRLTRLGKVLRSDHPRSMRVWPRYLALKSSALPWADLVESVRTGGSAFPRVHGHSIWDHLEQHPEEGVLFNQMMRLGSELQLPGIVASYPWPERGTICDVGGGVGTTLAAILAVRPELRGILVEPPAVLADAEKYLSSVGVRDRVELISGDALGGIEATADLYVLKDVLHDWGDKASATILDGIRAVAPVGSRVVVVEATLEHTDAHPVNTVMDMLMLVQTEDGRQRSVSELRGLLADAGFTPAGVYSGFHSLVEGVAT